MDQELLNMIIINVPNFVFAFIAIIALMRRLEKKDKLVYRLIENWQKCEDGNDTQRIISSKPIQ